MSGSETRLRWGHININVSNLDRSIDFYKKLGFETFIPAIPYLAIDSSIEKKQLPNGSSAALGIASGTKARACIMQLGDGFPKLDLTELALPEQSSPLSNSDTGIVRICLVSEDLQRDYSRLKADGVEFISEPKTGHNGLADLAVCKDPDGTLIELLQVYLDRWEPLISQK